MPYLGKPLIPLPYHVFKVSNSNSDNSLNLVRPDSYSYHRYLGELRMSPWLGIPPLWEAIDRTHVDTVARPQAATATIDLTWSDLIAAGSTLSPPCCNLIFSNKTPILAKSPIGEGLTGGASVVSF
jgi:hypothetical protein